jgi:oxalate decarboxylase/phosphoglucose isomerase-like protein (cupin superfamily)
MAERFIYDGWMEGTGLPIHKGYYIEDLRTVEVAWWESRGVGAAFLQLAGMHGVVEARIQEVPARGKTAPYKTTVDEMVYVLDGRGVASVWTDPNETKQFEWATRSLFVLPPNSYYRIANTSGSTPARLLHYNYLPVAMSAVPQPRFFFENDYLAPADGNVATDFYSAATVHEAGSRSSTRRRQIWSGNFFPDLQAWDKLQPYYGRGAGGKVVFIRPPQTELSAHMSVFPARSYKKAHRHGPGRVIVIPGGEGYSIMWDELGERVVIPWHEGSCFVPPNRWFHQHFNLGSAPARYLALHPPKQFKGYAEKVEDRARDQIEYPDEDPAVRQMFEERLAARGLVSGIPPEAYVDPEYEWQYDDAAPSSTEPVGTVPGE